MTVSRLDHVAFPTDNMDEMVAFYVRLGFSVDDEHVPMLRSVCQGDMKINIHDPSLWHNPKFTLRGPTAQPGCGDLCMVWGDTEEALVEMLATADVEVIVGPVGRTGGKSTGTANGTSRYIRDPDGNLLEFIIY